MVRTLAAFAAVSLAWGLTSAHAQTVRAIAEEPQTEVKGDPNRRVCRIQEVTGSRLQKGKRCRTAREWAAADLETRMGVRALRQPQDSSVMPSQRRQTPGNRTPGRP